MGSSFIFSMWPLVALLVTLLANRKGKSLEECVQRLGLEVVSTTSAHIPGERIRHQVPLTVPKGENAVQLGS